MKEVIAEMIRPFTMDEILQGVMSFKETPGFSTTRQKRHEAPAKGRLAVVAYQISNNNSVSVFNGNGFFGQMGKSLSTLHLKFPEKQKNVNSFEFRLIEIAFEESENSKYNGRFFIKDDKWYRIKHRSENTSINPAKDTEPSSPTLQADVAFWNSIKDSNDLAPFQLYLSRFPNGTFVDLARHRISLAEAKLAKSKAPATVHIYQILGGFGKAPIYLNGEIIARLVDRRHFSISLEPGKYTFSVSKPNQGIVTINIVGGQEYYIQNRWRWGKA